MHEQLTHLIGVGVLGGAARILLGVETKTSWRREAMIMLFISLPVGVLAGLVTATFVEGKWLPFLVCYAASVSSLNITRAVLAVNFGKLIDKVFGKVLP